MKAIILAAGQGTRLRPYTNMIPKPMIVIGGKPILEHIIERLSKHGITEIAINLHHQAKVIKDQLRDGADWSVSIRYSHERSLLGTAGALKPLSDFFDERFLVWYGDNLCDIDLARLINFHLEKSGIATLALHWREDVSQSGVVELDDGSRILRFLEKPCPAATDSHWVSAGIYVLERRILDYIPEGQNCDFGKVIFSRLLQSGEEMYGYRMGNEERIWWIDRVEDYEHVVRTWKG